MIKKSKRTAGHFQKALAFQKQVRLVNPAGFRDVSELQTDAGTAVTP